MVISFPRRDNNFAISAEVQTNFISRLERLCGLSWYGRRRLMNMVNHIVLFHMLLLVFASPKRVYLLLLHMWYLLTNLFMLFLLVNKDDKRFICVVWGESKDLDVALLNIIFYNKTFNHVKPENGNRYATGTEVFMIGAALGQSVHMPSGTITFEHITREFHHTNLGSVGEIDPIE
ncbi:hypothetical protein LIER_39495 [Lithospermum erythrorhizon]|uniref:Uncharacterized protein n=1 Tax=Lithospermum erythrorhizon TaxID=34254 RepID=A0AAV3QIC3_LITER